MRKATRQDITVRNLRALKRRLRGLEVLVRRQARLIVNLSKRKAR